MGNSRITKNKLQFLDRNNNPIKNSKISYELINNEFLFGSGAFDFVSYCSDLKPDSIAFYTDKKEIDKEFYKDRTDKWLDIYNYGTLPFYWGGYEPEEGDVQYESRMNAAKYLKERNVTLKGHPLCWHTKGTSYTNDNGVVEIEGIRGTYKFIVNGEEFVRSL